MKPDISIIVPIYNSEKYLKKCIDSLLSQTKKECEFILINDGSKDSSEKIIKSYHDKRIKYFKNPNQGIGKTRNFGIQNAKGKYLLFVDSDDSIEKNACEVLFQKAENENLDMVICDYYKEYENGTKEEEKLISFPNTTLQSMPTLLYEVNLSPWNKIYRKSYLEENKIQFVENLKYEDAPFVVKALDKARKIGKVDLCLNDYRIHGNSETTIRDEKCLDIIQIIDEIRSYLKEKEEMQDALNQLTVRTLTNYTIQQRVQIDKKIRKKFIEEAFAYLEREVPDYKNNKYYKTRGFFQRTIEKSKKLTKWYCFFYSWKNKR